MSARDTNILLIGVGNCGRQDDGLGWSFLDRIATFLPANWDIEYRYQLQVEDAELLSGYDTVYFVDADRRGHLQGYIIEKLLPAPSDAFTSHELKPESVLHLASEIYGERPDAIMLGISGQRFELELGLSPTAEQNLSKALEFFKTAIIHYKSENSGSCAEHADVKVKMR